MCSSKTEQFDRYWGLTQDADAYLAKSFDAIELFIMLKHLLRK